MMKRFLGNMFIIIGILMLLLAVLAAIAAVISLSERIRFGSPGLMFADVEILAVLTFLLFIAGGALLWFGRRLARRPRSEAHHDP